MAYQTTYDQYQAPGYPGLLANMEEWNGLTRTASTTIAFGAPVQRNGDRGCAPLASGGEFIGIARARHFSHMGGGAGDNYGTGDNVAVLDAGVVWGLADAAITVGAALNFNTATGRYTTAATSGTVIAVPGAEADIAAAGAGSLFKVRLRRIPS